MELKCANYKFCYYSKVCHFTANAYKNVKFCTIVEIIISKKSKKVKNYGQWTQKLRIF